MLDSLTGLQSGERPCVRQLRRGSLSESIQTTGDIYTDWDIEQLAETLLEAVDD